MEPQAAIASIETELRALIRSLMPNGEWRSVLGVEKMAALKERRSEEAKRRSPAVVARDLLQYTHFYELRKVLEAKWDLFGAALGSKAEFRVWAGQIEDFRNAPAHSRELLPFERSLLEGIAGSIRTKVTVFRSSQDKNLNYYPVIESIVDSFGHQIVDLEVDTPFGGQATTDVTVRPGDSITFHARGWDPQGRDLTWSLEADGMSFLTGVVGTEVDLTWIVRDEDVGRNRHIYVSLSSSGRFHRHSQYDHRGVFRYIVDPPDETS